MLFVAAHTFIGTRIDHYAYYDKNSLLYEFYRYGSQIEIFSGNRILYKRKGFIGIDFIPYYRREEKK